LQALRAAAIGAPAHSVPFSHISGTIARARVTSIERVFGVCKWSHGPQEFDLDEIQLNASSWYRCAFWRRVCPLRGTVQFVQVPSHLVSRVPTDENLATTLRL